MLLEENTVVADRFRLVRMIGRGGMGSVWHAFDTRLDNACALKFIEGELANVADAHARFQREARAAAALRSPHVVEIKDHGVWQGSPYIAMELLEGEDLGKALANAGGKLPPAQVNTIIQQVCRALTKAHQAGIVHRDLKPDNVFLVTDDDRQLVKILDFGVAKQTSQAIDGSNTKTGAMLGTPYYMSPEQAQGIKSVDARSDLWSLAVIVYQCLTGRLPFESEALGDLLVKIIVQPIPVPSHVAQVPPGFDRWWAKAAERNPDHRFASAKEFATQLEIALGGLSVTEVGMTSPALHGTAVIGAHGQSRPFESTPNPGAFNAGRTTPHPGNPTPHPYGGTPYAGNGTPFPGNGTPFPGGGGASGPGGGSYPGHPTPPGVAMGMGPQLHPHGTSGLGASGNPVTFSGVEPPPTIAKKGPPVAVIAAVAVGLLLVVGGIGFVASRRSADVPPSVAATTTPSTVEPKPQATDAPPATATAAATDAPPAPSAATATPSATVAAASTAATGKAHGSNAKPVPTAAGTTKPTAAPTSSAKKKWDPGF